MEKNQLTHAFRSTTLLIVCLLVFCSTTVFGAIEREINVYVGDTFTFSPWNDAKSNYSGYSCASTTYKSETADAFSISEGTRTTTKYPKPYDTTGWLDGYYCSYKAKALKTGKLIKFNFI